MHERPPHRRAGAVAAALEARAETERSLRDIAARITSLARPRRDPRPRRRGVAPPARLRRRPPDPAVATTGTYLVPVIVAGGMDDRDRGLAAADALPARRRDQRPRRGGGPADLDVRLPDRPADPARGRGRRRGRAARPPGDGRRAAPGARPARSSGRSRSRTGRRARSPPTSSTSSRASPTRPRSRSRTRTCTSCSASPRRATATSSRTRRTSSGRSTPDARFTFVSDTCERLTGWKPEELLGKHFGALVHERSREVAEIDWTAGLGDGPGGPRAARPGQPPAPRRPPDPGRVHRVRHPRRGRRFAGANGSVRDMSERDRLERELRESEDRFRFLIENSPDIIFSIDPDGRFTLRLRRRPPIARRRAGGAGRDAVPRPHPVPRRTRSPAPSSRCWPPTPSSS